MCTRPHGSGDDYRIVWPQPVPSKVGPRTSRTTQARVDRACDIDPIDRGLVLGRVRGQTQDKAQTRAGRTQAGNLGELRSPGGLARPFGATQQVPHPDPECRGQAADVEQRRVAAAGLDLGDIGSLEPGNLRQRLLREVELLTTFTDCGAEGDEQRLAGLEGHAPTL